MTCLCDGQVDESVPDFENKRAESVNEDALLPHVEDTLREHAAYLQAGKPVRLSPYRFVKEAVEYIRAYVSTCRAQTMVERNGALLSLKEINQQWLEDIAATQEELQTWGKKTGTGSRQAEGAGISSPQHH